MTNTNELKNELKKVTEEWQNICDWTIKINMTMPELNENRKKEYELLAEIARLQNLING